MVKCVSNYEELLGLIDMLNERIVNLQLSHVVLEEKLKNIECEVENTLNNHCLQIIELLDFIYRIENSLDSKEGILSYIIRKLNLFLQGLDVQEIILEGNKLDSRLTRVIDTKEASANVEIGSIIEICRRGYIRAGKVVRLVDVITAK